MLWNRISKTWELSPATYYIVPVQNVEHPKNGPNDVRLDLNVPSYNEPCLSLHKQVRTGKGVQLCVTAIYFFPCWQSSVSKPKKWLQRCRRIGYFVQGKSNSVQLSLDWCDRYSGAQRWWWTSVGRYPTMWTRDGFSLKTALDCPFTWPTQQKQPREFWNDHMCVHNMLVVKPNRSRSRIIVATSSS